MIKQKFIYSSLIAVSVFLLASCASNETKVENAMDIFNQAEKEYNMGLLTEAEANYRKVVEIAPQTSEAWIKLGNIHVRTGFLEAAIAMYERCINTNPEDIRCWNNLAVTRMRQGMQILQTATQGGHVTEEADLVRLVELYTKMADVIAQKKTDVGDETDVGDKKLSSL